MRVEGLCIDLAVMVTGHRTISYHINLPHQPQITEYVQTELLNHRRLDHTHIIRMREVFLTAHHLCIVLEYAELGDLYVGPVGRVCCHFYHNAPHH